MGGGGWTEVFEEGDIGLRPRGPPGKQAAPVFVTGESEGGGAWHQIRIDSSAGRVSVSSLRSRSLDPLFLIRLPSLGPLFYFDPVLSLLTHGPTSPLKQP